MLKAYRSSGRAHVAKVILCLMGAVGSAAAPLAAQDARAFAPPASPGDQVLAIRLATPAPASAVHVPRTLSQPVLAVERQQESAGSAVGGAIMAGAIGIVAGGAIGYAVATGPTGGDGEYDGLGGLLVGGFVGSTVGTSVGAHIGNGRRGNIALVLGGTLATGVLSGLATALAAPAGILIVPPIVQVITAVTIERRTAR